MDIKNENQSIKSRLLSNELLNESETAKILGLKSARTLALWRHTKRYPSLRYIKVGRLVRYPAEAVQEFMRLRTVGDIA